jgi:hypothetical protein
LCAPISVSLISFLEFLLSKPCIHVSLPIS